MGHKGQVLLHPRHPFIPERETTGPTNMARLHHRPQGTTAIRPGPLPLPTKGRVLPHLRLQGAPERGTTEPTNGLRHRRPQGTKAIKPWPLHLHTKLLLPPASPRG